MNMKNATIILIFLLCILGLIIGVYCTESSESVDYADEYESTVHVEQNGTITIHVEKKDNPGNSLVNFLHEKIKNSEKRI